MKRHFLNRSDRNGLRLRHLLLAGGSIAEWADFTDEQWDARLADAASVALRAGAAFVTVHPHEIDPAAVEVTSAVPLARRDLSIGGVSVVVNPIADGRQRIRQVVESWPSRKRLSEKNLSKALFRRAGEPDLVIVLGPANQLPMSLVWELAYGELVFIESDWTSLDLGQLEAAIDEFALRQRRFGGIE